MTELEQYVSSYFEVGTEETQKIASLFKHQTIKKGEFFLRKDAVADKLSFVQSGMLRVYSMVGDKEVTQWIGTKGSFITELSSLVFASRSRWDFQALTDTQLYSIDKADYNRIAEEIPRWPEFEKYFIVKCFTIMEDRIFSHLSMSAEERYDYLYTQNKELFTQVPLQYIASMLGMTPETFSRVRKRQLP